MIEEDFEKQEKFLEDNKKIVKEQAYFMRQAIDQLNTKDALRHSCLMLNELKTSLLTAKNYFMLWQMIFEELRALEAHFRDEYKRGRKIIQLYDQVQNSTHLIARLYLMVTVGSVYIQTHEISAKVILYELLEYLKSVQHPIKGLFLRYYFLKTMKDRLPDTDSEYAGEGGNIDDALSILFQCLSEMNKLWIRLKVKREKERVDVKVLISECISRISNLEGVNCEKYQKQVFPQLVEMIKTCKDGTSQSFIVDCMIQVFPDDYQFACLDKLLEVITTDLDPAVNSNHIFICLMKRLENFSKENQSTITTTYEQFYNVILSIVERASSQEVKNILILLVSFLNYSVKAFHSIEQTNQILKLVVKIGNKNSGDFSEEQLTYLVKFLTTPLEEFSVQVLKMDEFPKLIKNLTLKLQKQVAVKLCEVIVKNQYKMVTAVQLMEIFQFIESLIDDENKSDQEQQLLCKLIHLGGSPNLYVSQEIQGIFIDKYLKNNKNQFTIPSLFYAQLSLLKKTGESKERVEIIDKIQKLLKKFDNMSVLIMLRMELCVQISLIDNHQEMDNLVYDLLSSTIEIYSEEINDNQLKISILNLMISKFCSIGNLSVENQDSIASNLTQLANKLLKKNEQCIAVLTCTHLFYNGNYQLEQRVQECFKRCMKLAGQAVQSNNAFNQLYVDILKKMKYFKSFFKIRDWDECISTIKESGVSTNMLKDID